MSPLSLEEKRLEREKRLQQTAEAMAADALDELEVIQAHDDLARLIGREWADDVRHVAKWCRWFIWDGATWVVDEKLVHLKKLREFVRQALRDDEKLRRTMLSAQGIAGIESLIRSNPEQAASVDQWDCDPLLLGTPKGTIDLRDGTLRPPSPSDFITKRTAVVPAPPGTPHPKWTALLHRIFRRGGEPDFEVIQYLQRLAGYGLTGSVIEHVFALAYGTGANGKSVYFNTLRSIMGDYGVVAAPDLLLVSRGDRHPADVAALRGARLATISELPPGRALDLSKTKQLTGGEMLAARGMRQDWWNFMPQFKLVIFANAKPRIGVADEAIRRRIHLIDFAETIPPAERNPHLSAELRAEWPSILRWQLDGAIAWQEQGLNPPESVRASSKAYLDSQDEFSAWIATACDLEVGAFALGRQLRRSWKDWCFERSVDPAIVDLDDALAQRDVRAHRSEGRSGQRGYRGIKLVSAELPDDSWYTSRGGRDD